MEEEEEAWEGEGHAGIARNTFHPHTQLRRRFAFNSAQARLLGLHPEEAVARFGARDLPQIFTEADSVRYLLAEMASTLKDTYTHYGRMVMPRFRSRGEGAFLFCRTSIRSFDAAGRIIETKNILRAISPEEYDAAVRRDPTASPLYALGDRRSGRELLAAAAKDTKCTLLSMAATRAGRAELDGIAAAVELLAV